MREEWRFALHNATLLDIAVGVRADIIIPIVTPGVQSVARDTHGITMMPRWCADSLNYLQKVSSN